MPQAFAAYSGPPDPLLLFNTGAGLLSAMVVGDVGVTWSDGTTGTIPAGTVAASAYGGTAVDNTAAVYLVLAIKGASTPKLLKEADLGSADTVLGGTPTWARWQRVANGTVYPDQQL